MLLQKLNIGDYPSILHQIRIFRAFSLTTSKGALWPDRQSTRRRITLYFVMILNFFTNEELNHFVKRTTHHITHTPHRSATYRGTINVHTPLYSSTRVLYVVSTLLLCPWEWGWVWERFGDNTRTDWAIGQWMLPTYHRAKLQNSKLPAENSESPFSFPFYLFSFYLFSSQHTSGKSNEVGGREAKQVAEAKQAVEEAKFSVQIFKLSNFL